MKKLVVLLMVLAVSTMSSATILLDYNEGTGKIEVSSTTTDTYTVFLGIADASNGAIVSGSVEILAAAGNTASVGGLIDGAGFTGYDYFVDLNANHADPFDTIQAETVQFQAALVNLTGPVTIQILADDTTTELASVTVAPAIPEPATLAILGLGGLLIRRKK